MLMASAAPGGRFRGVTRGVGGRYGGVGGDAAGPSEQEGSEQEGRCREVGRGLRSRGRGREFLSLADAARVSKALVGERLIACANLLPGARSIYPWKGEVADRGEVVVLMKSRKQDWTALLSRLHELHPYDTPECLAVRVAAGTPKYMAWLEEVLGGGQG